MKNRLLSCTVFFCLLFLVACGSEDCKVAKVGVELIITDSANVPISPDSIKWNIDNDQDEAYPIESGETFFTIGSEIGKYEIAIWANGVDTIISVDVQETGTDKCNHPDTKVIRLRL